MPEYLSSAKLQRHLRDAEEYFSPGVRFKATGQRDSQGWSWTRLYASHFDKWETVSGRFGGYLNGDPPSAVLELIAIRKIEPACTDIKGIPKMPDQLDGAASYAFSRRS